MFYAISGFVFAYVYLSTNEKVSGKEFFVNRFARLYPLHFATLIIVAILQLINWGTTNFFQIVHYNDFYHFILQLFFDAKSDEICKIYSEAYPNEQVRIIKTLVEIDPAQSSKYSHVPLSVFANES